MLNEHEMKFSRKRNININRITSSNSDSNIDNSNDNSNDEYNEDTIDKILQELVH